MRITTASPCSTTSPRVDSSATAVPLFPILDNLDQEALTAPEISNATTINNTVTTLPTFATCMPSDRSTEAVAVPFLPELDDLNQSNRVHN